MSVTCLIRRERRTFLTPVSGTVGGDISEVES
jgi:hypothetical protein